MIKTTCLALSIGMLSTVPAYAATVNYTLEGDLEVLLLGATTDVYSLNGAHFQWDISFDTGQSAFASSSDPGGFYSDYETSPSPFSNTRSTITFTGRSNGAADSTVSMDRIVASTINFNGAGPDILSFSSSNVLGEFSGLFTQGGEFTFNASVYGADGPAALPTDWTAAQVFGVDILDFSSNAGVDYIIAAPLGNVTVNAVPLPGSLWLLGSGLLGFMATRRSRGNNADS